MGTIHVNSAIYTVFQVNVNTGGGSDNCGSFDEINRYNTPPTCIGDHLDAFYRYDDVGSPQYDGTYDRLPDLFMLPPNGGLHTLADDSVKQDTSDTLPAKYQSPESTGTLWQVGSGFTILDAPALASDPAGSHRIAAFFTPESYPGDQGIGGHLIGFASVVLPADSMGIPPLWSGVWKDTSSPNDGEYKLASSQPLRTLYLKEFTPVIAFRGDPGIRSSGPGILYSRHVAGMAGWYRDGYYYLILTTLLSRDDVPPETHDHCALTPDSRAVPGQILFRIRADHAANGGLWLSPTRTPQVEIYQSATPGGARTFVALPHPENIVSFSDDDRNPVGDLCDEVSRQKFIGCCTNPNVMAARALITEPMFTPQNSPSFNVASTFTWQDPCSRYTVLQTDVATADAAAWQPNYLYHIGDIIRPSASRPDAGAKSYVCVTSGESGDVEPSWPARNPPPDRSDRDIVDLQTSDGAAVWQSAFAAWLLRLHEHATPCGSGEPAYTFEHAGIIVHPYPSGYTHDDYYGPEANISPLPGSTDTLLGYRHVRNRATGYEGHATFTVVPNLENCALAVTPETITINAAGGDRTATVTAPETRCVWTASTGAAWFTITGSQRGAGSSNIAISISPNTGQARSATLTIGEKHVTISQSAPPPSPAHLVATRTAETSVDVSWQAIPGSATYEIYRGTSTTNYILAGTSSTTTYTDPGVEAGVTYLYKARANVDGAESVDSNLDFTTTIIFDDDPLQPDTPIRAAHISQLRQAVNAIRLAGGLAPATYTDDPLVPGETVVSAMHITELREKLNEALAELAITSPTFTDEFIVAGETAIKQAHMRELRAATK